MSITKLEKPYDPKEVEKKIYEKWDKSGYFNPDNLVNADKESFTIALPPPNVTGTLHMGHALNATIQDILIRWKRMQGRKTLWLPGTDHAGIATQNVVEKKLKKEGTSRHQLGREQFLEKIWEWKNEYGEIILNQLKKIGASCDWSRTRFTMDEDYSKAVKEAFIHYYNKGWIYQGDRLVNWCPRCKTSLSDLELEYKEEKSKLYYIKYPLVNKDGFITVATTRPETILGDAAVAVNPDDERFKNLIGQKIKLPIQNREIPIIADDSIDKEFGTGAVKVTPAHDFTDAEIGERHNLPKYKIINERGKMTNEAGEICAGFKVLECREKIIEKLKELNLLEKEEDYVHNTARCYRCDSVIEPLISKQWFLKMSKLAELAIDAVQSKKIKFHPERWSEVYLNWLQNVKDWCISRQIWWGHQIPVYFCFDCNKKKIKLNPEFLKDSEGNQSGTIHYGDETGEYQPDYEHTKRLIKNDGEFINLNVDYFISEKCPICGSDKIIQSSDTLDTWFSSALWPFATLHWPDKNHSDLKNFYPNQVLSTARDIINLWVARMIFSGIEFMGAEPFSDIYIHATVLTKDGKRMSKSLGTGIDPLGLIEKYGADAVRFGLIYQTMGGQDMKFDENTCLAGKKFCNKIWNAARFVITMTGDEKLNLEIPKENLTDEDKKILADFKTIKNDINNNLADFQFGQAIHKIYEFFWHEFCDKYIEIAKKNKTKESKEILAYILSDSIKLLHPIMPFITEELWQTLKELNLIETNADLLIAEKW